LQKPKGETSLNEVLQKHEENDSKEEGHKETLITEKVLNLGFEL
jgi:hypothetical protein